ncbi:exocyst complex component 3-like [Oppia nitens]|uniref:exocyst complex component 3-like n=1 Tax=Oppia nitens TaxID=1686743 RepID=UPI0023D9AE00|nr:exocyst complex component 3-like [Oppia nitens]
MQMMNIEALEADARQTALKHVSNMLQRPDQLEKVDQYKKRVVRKMTSVEGMLKTAMQTQLDGVRTGLIHLQTSQQDIDEIKRTLKEVEETFPVVPNLVEKLKSVREESMKHSQYVAAMDNLKHIFNVPESILKTREAIADGKLLIAHQYLTDLENSRDDLLFELHRLPATSMADKNLLKHYYSEVEKLSEELGKQLWLIIRLTLNSVRKEPSIIVTALRIIEREEKADELALKRSDTSGFMAIGRPKQWRKRVFEILEEAIYERIAGNQFHDRHQNKMWLVLHLEVTRLLFIEDLRVVKNACVPCFPPSYDIVNKMLYLYHKCLSAHLHEMANQLEGNEYVTVLNWVQAYDGPELMGHRDLDFDIKSRNFEPLLSKPLVDELTNKYLSTVEKNYKEWLSNTIAREVKDWDSSNQPECDESRHYQTTTPVIVFQMIDQHLQVARTVTRHLVNRVLIISMDHLSTFAKQYKDAVKRYAKSHFENRNQLFTPNMIAITNNCLSFIEIAMNFKQEYKSGDSTELEANRVFDNVVKSFEELKEESIGHLLYEIFLDVDREINKVGTQEWFDSKISVIENICLTLEDYFRDYVYLKEKNSDRLKEELQNKLAKGYITAILLKKMQLRNQSQRELFAKKFIREAEILKAAIAKLPTKMSTNIVKNSPFDCLPLLAEFLKLKDLSMLFLEVSGLVKKYPDIKVEHLTALLSLREDMLKTNVKKQVEDMMSDYEITSDEKTIFSKITLN